MSYISKTDMLTKLGVGKDKLQRLTEDNNYPFITKGKNLYYLEDNNYIVEIRDELIKDKCKVITLGNNKGGVSKTTHTAHIASILSFYGYRVLMIDMDAQSNLSISFGIYDRTEKNIVNVLDKGLDAKEAIVNIKNKNGVKINKLDLLPNNPNMIEPYNELNIRKDYSLLHNAIEDLKNEYDIILIDTPPTISTILEMSIVASDYVIVCFTADAFSNTGIVNYFDPYLKANKYKKEVYSEEAFIIGGILGKYKKNTVAEKIHSKNIEQNFYETTGMTIYKQFISSASIISEVNGLCGSVLFYDHKNKMSLEYMELANEILENLYLAMKNKAI